MKKDRILNPQIAWEVAALGHTEYLCIADCGLPIPKDVKVVDVSVRAGLPGFLDLLRAVAEELVVESVVVASELPGKNAALLRQMKEILGEEIPFAQVPHEEFKQKVRQAKCVIRTGETSPFANAILVGGVNF